MTMTGSALKQRYRRSATTERVTTDVAALYDALPLTTLLPARIPARATRPAPITNSYKKRETTSPTGPNPNYRPNSYTPEYDDYNEYEEEIAPRTTTRLPQQNPAKKSHRAGWILFWIGVILLFIGIDALLTVYICPWYAATFNDPGKYGPAQGMVVTGVFGGGDSKAHPSTIIAMNIGGRITLLKLIPGKQVQAIPGVDLSHYNFFDAAHAKVDLQVGDFDRDGHEDLRVTFYDSTFTSPFERTHSTIILYGDGKGNLASRQ